MRKVLLAVMILFAAHLGTVGAAKAESMTWKFRSYHANIVDIQLYAPARNHVWPGNTQVWSVKDYQVNDITINCVRGEKICYGAWVRGTESSYWGAGRGNKRSCTNCCGTCGGGPMPVINLNR